MQVFYTDHAIIRSRQRGISHVDISHVLRHGQVTHGKANKTLLTDIQRNICVVAVSYPNTYWLVITAYRTEIQN